MGRKHAGVPAPGEGKRGVDGYLGYLLRQANSAMRGAMDAALAEVNLTMAQFLVLTLVKAYPGSSSADIARLAQLTPQTMTGIVRNLERDGALTRTAATEGRVIALEITPQGAAALAACRARVEAHEARMTQGLSKSEEKIIRRWLVDLATTRLRDDHG